MWETLLRVKNGNIELYNNHTPPRNPITIVIAPAIILDVPLGEEVSHIDDHRMITGRLEWTSKM